MGTEKDFTLYPVAKLGSEVLLIKESDIGLIGGEDALDVMSVDVDLKYHRIEPPIELEKHLKFNPWEEVTDEERETILLAIKSAFSPEEIHDKIEIPLMVDKKKNLQAISERIAREILEDPSVMSDRGLLEKSIDRYAEGVEIAMEAQKEDVAPKKIITVIRECVTNEIKARLTVELDMEEIEIYEKLVSLGLTNQSFESYRENKVTKHKK